MGSLDTWSHGGSSNTQEKVQRRPHIARKEMGEAQVERKKISRYQLGFLDTWGRGAQRHYRSAPSTPVEICNAP